MSKLFEQYKRLKEKDNKKLYLFKSGTFYLFLDDDARKVSEYTTLKCIKLNDETVKCGFPSNSLEKYLQIFKNINFDVMIVEKDDVINFDVDYLKNKKVKELLEEIKNMDINHMSPMEAFEIIISLKGVLKNEWTRKFINL